MTPVTMNIQPKSRHCRKSAVMRGRVENAADPAHDRIDCSATGSWQLQRTRFGWNLTEDGLRQAGIKRGMRVLDLRCGTGDASLLIAKLVGPSGLVAGVDRSAGVIDLAQRRATVAGQCYWAHFVAADPDTFVPPGLFDVIIVRLEHLRTRKTAAGLPRLFSHLHADGVIILVVAERAPDEAASSCDRSIQP